MDEATDRAASSGSRVRPTAAAVGALAVLAAAFFVFGCRPEPPLPAGHRNLLLITLDTVRADFLEPYGYPSPSSPVLAAFADRALVFERAYATAPRTGPSHASMLTARHPSSHGVLFNGVDLPGTLREGSVTLAEHLAHGGFVTGGVVSVSAVGAEHGFDRGFASFEHERTRRKRDKPEAGGGANHVTDTARRWLRRHHRERFFLWVHYYEAHLPFHPEDRTCRELGLDPCPLVTFDSAMAGAHDPQAIEDSYRGEIFELDRYVGELLAGLEEHGVAHNTVVAITADHGEYLGEHGQFGHQELFDEMLHVPLMIRAPELEPGRRDDLVSLVDLAPTLLGLLGEPPLRTAEGRDLLATATADADGTYVFAEWRHHAPFLGERTPVQRDIQISVQTKRAKLIRDILFPERSMAFDLEADPAESQDLHGRDGEPWDALRQALDTHIRALPADVAAIERLTLDPETVEALQALGYL